MNIQYCSVGKLYSLLIGQPRPILLLGAGASLKSGVPLAGTIVEKAARWAYAIAHGRSPDDPRLQRSDWFPWLERQGWYHREVPPHDNYAAAVQNLLQPRQARADFFRQLLETSLTPSAGYDKLAEFLALGFVPIVLTTNFDSLLPEMRVLKRRPHFIDVIQTPSDYTKFSTSPQHPQLVYLHGSVEHYTDKNIEREVQELDQKLVEMLFPLLRDRPLIVVGYRGGEPSVMQHLLLQNADAANGYRHGIFWCKLRTDKEEGLSPHVSALAQKIGGNFSLVDIDGFDELFERDLWRLHLDARGPREVVAKPSISPPPTFDMRAASHTGLENLDWPTLRPRLLKYCQSLQIRVPAEANQNWFKDQLLQTNLAFTDSDGDVRITLAGCLLFGNLTQSEISSAKVIIRVHGDQNWLRGALGAKELGVEAGNSASPLEHTIDGNLWAQYDSIMGILGSFNRPFRLKGTTSETVMPYPPLAIKEVIVNALVHRDYGVDSPIIIEVEPGSIRVTNPGGLVDEVQRRVEAGSIEQEIRLGHRGIKGYRNPVLADLFYGSGEMDKAGSGLSDVYRIIRAGGGDVSFGPTNENSKFNVQIFSRPEAVDAVTGTAVPAVLTSTTYAANLLEVVELPDTIFHGETEISWVGDIWKRLPDQWIPPFLLHEGRIFSFHDLDDAVNPLHKLVGTVEPLGTAEFFRGPDGERLLVRMLNDSLRKHFQSRGMIVDGKRKRAYFPRTLQGSRSISYQARLRKARRTVVKARSSPATGKVTYWEHEALGYKFHKFGNSWSLMLEPGYVFTFDGFKGLLAPERINKLSTKRAARDYNSAVLNDLSFWTWLLAGGASANFRLNICGEQLVASANLPETLEEGRDVDDESDERWSVVAALQAERAIGFTPFDIDGGLVFTNPPRIALSSHLPTVTINDMKLLPEENGEDILRDDDLDELAEELEELAEQGRQNQAAESESKAEEGSDVS